MHPEYTPNLLDRFWSKVNKHSGLFWNGTECWVWAAGTTANGYGLFHLPGKRLVYAHRFTSELHDGPIPPGVECRHSCDNPPCCRPEHLERGSHADNMRDMVARGRVATGERHISRLHPERVARGERHGSRTMPDSRCRGDRHPGAKLTEAAVRTIRIRYAAGTVSQSQLAAEFGVLRGVIRDVVNRKTWRHVT